LVGDGEAPEARRGDDDSTSMDPGGGRRRGIRPAEDKSPTLGDVVPRASDATATSVAFLRMGMLTPEG